MKVAIGNHSNTFCLDYDILKELQNLGYPFCKETRFGLHLSHPESSEDQKKMRTHPILIQVLEKHFPGDDPQFKVVNIPFDTLEGWYIDSGNDRGEFVRENHRYWF